MPKNGRKAVASFAGKRIMRPQKKRMGGAMKRFGKHLSSMAVASLIIFAVADTTQAQMTIPEQLLDVAAVVCAKIDTDGVISGTYIISSTASHDKDAQIIAAVKQLHWAKASADDPSRNIWFPMGISFGEMKAPPTPATCSGKGPSDEQSESGTGA
jgi:hypothetical protein